jgi:hypothetical protein
MEKAPFSKFYFQKPMSFSGYDDDITDTLFAKNIILYKIFNFMGMRDLMTLLFSENDITNDKLDSLCMNCGNIEEQEECEECEEGWVTCDDCGGDGDYECDSCGGWNEVDCDECGGDGTIYETVTCDTCGGDGEIEEGNETVECDECDGDGEIEGEVECDDCDGRGQVECDECDNGRIPCNTCDYGNVECGDCGGNWEGWVCGSHNPASYSLNEVIKNPKYKKAGIRFIKFDTAKKATDYILNSDYISTCVWASDRSSAFYGINNLFTDRTFGSSKVTYDFMTITNRPKETIKMLIENDENLHHIQKFTYLHNVIYNYADGQLLAEFPKETRDGDRNISLSTQYSGWSDKALFKGYADTPQRAVWVIETNITWQSSLNTLMNWSSFPF